MTKRARAFTRRALAGLLLVGTLSACSVEDMIRLAFEEHGPAVQDEAVEVARCESGLNPEATNGQYRGLFQLGRYHYWRLDEHGWSWSDPLHNAQAASDLYGEQGWGPWSCRP